MPSRRMIDPAFWQSETVASLNIEQRYLFIGLFSNADDQGRLRGHSALIRNTVFPYDEIALEQIERDLKALEAIGTVILYQVDGKTFIQIANWWKYQHPQWAYPSEYPNPKGWNDRLRYRAGGEILTRNWKGELDALDSGSRPDSPDDEPPPEQPSPNGTGYPLPEEQAYIKEETPKALPNPLPKALPKALEIGIELDIELEPKEEDEESHVHEREEKVAAIMTLYQNNINISVAPITAEEMLSDEFLGLPLFWWEEAVKIATDNNVRKWSYVRGILLRSIQAGLSPITAGPPNGKVKAAPPASPLFPPPALDSPEPERIELTPEERILTLFKERAATEGIPAPQWREHIAPMKVAGCSGGRIQVEVNPFSKEILEHKFNRVLDRIAQELSPGGFEYVVT